MKKVVKLGFIFVVCILVVICQKSVIAKAPDIPSNKEIKDFVKEAFTAQISLGKQFYSMDEVKSILSPYFTNDYIALFNEENLTEQNGKFIAYGRDFALFYVPFFSYDEQTKIVFADDQKTIFVYQFFKATGEGMIIKNHYKTLVLHFEDDQLKIKDIFYSEQSPIELKDAYEKYSLVHS